MSIERARVIKGAFASHLPSMADTKSVSRGVPLGRRVPKALVDVHERASRIVAEANEKATAIVEQARASMDRVEAEAATQAREREIAKFAAELLTLRAAEERRREREIDQTIEIAMLLAERIVGQVLISDPERIGMLAAEALRETRGARQLQIEANPADVDALGTVLATLGIAVAKIIPNDELSRGSLIVQTELGRVDARIRPQLARLSEALSEALHSPVSVHNS